MRTRVMLGSVSYPGFELADDFSLALNILSSSISKLGYECERSDSSWQDLIPPKLSFLKLFQLTYYHTKFQSEISTLNLKNLTKIQVFLKVVLRLAKDLTVLSKKEFEKKHLKHFVLNQYITDKHLSTIGRFLNSQSKYLLVCENDIVLNESPTTFLDEVFDIAEAHNGALFINVSNNSSFSKVSDHFGGKEKNYSGSKVWKEIDFFVNGTAFYFINREMGARIYNFVVCRPTYRNCSVDWLFSLIGRKSKKTEVTCLIPSKVYVSNGSRSKC